MYHVILDGIMMNIDCVIWTRFFNKMTPLTHWPQNPTNHMPVRSEYWFRQWLVAWRHQAITWAYSYVVPDVCRHMASLGHIDFNSLWPSDTISRHRPGSTLAQIMACCLTAPSHYLILCWLFTSVVQWESPITVNSTGYSSDIDY